MYDFLAQRSSVNLPNLAQTGFREFLGVRLCLIPTKDLTLLHESGHTHNLSIV